MQLGSGYGIYAGFQGAKTLISIKDEYRELDQEGAKLPIDYKYYKGLSLSLQSWSDSSNISEVKGVIVKYPVFFSELLFNKLSHGTLSLFWNTTDYFISDSTNHRFIRNLVMLLKNGWKYSLLPITRTFLRESKKVRVSKNNSSYRKIETNHWKYGNEMWNECML